jgi:hypothetical protein
VVCAESATKRVKVRVLQHTGGTAKRKLYSTDAFRLRAAPPAVEDAVPPPAPSPAVEHDDDVALAYLLMQRVASLYPSLKDVQLNPRLTTPGSGLLRAFRQAIARATGEEVVVGGAAAAARHIQLLLQRHA